MPQSPTEFAASRGARLPKGRARVPHRPLALRCRVALVVGALGLVGAFAAACGDAEEPTEAPLTIAECEDLGGTPLFDPDDQRPSELDCPKGLRFMGEFEEDFYGGQGGVCCSDRAPPAAAADAAEAS